MRSSVIDNLHGLHPPFRGKSKTSAKCDVDKGKILGRFSIKLEFRLRTFSLALKLAVKNAEHYIARPSNIVLVRSVFAFFPADLKAKERLLRLAV